MAVRKLELLAPARDLRCGMAAIDHGADAVYIGGPQFSARAAASNTLSDIERLVGYAHQFSARVYVALNTLFRDEELEMVVQLTSQLATTGVDALIIQDVGLLEADLPPIPLHPDEQPECGKSRFPGKCWLLPSRFGSGVGPRKHQENQGG